MNRKIGTYIQYEEVPLPGSRGRLESELVEKGRGCWGRAEEACEDCAGEGPGREACSVGGDASAVRGRFSGGEVTAKSRGTGRR